MSVSTERTSTPSRRDRKKAQRRQEIYETALELFASKGFDNVTVDDITETVDIGKGTFFNYFPSKDDLLVEYRRRLMDEVHSHSERVDEPTARASFKSYFRKFIRCIRRDGAIFDILLRQVLARPAEVELGEDWVTRRHRIFDRFLSSSTQRGEINPDVDVALVAEMIVDHWTGTLLEWAYRGKKFSLEAKMTKKLDLLFDALAR